MGLSYDQAVALGLGDLHPDAPGRKTARNGSRPAPATPAPGAPDDGMNQTERAFAAHLDCLRAVGLITTRKFQPLKLRLAGHTWYTPDFLVSREGEMFVVEVKGHLEDDAAVKIKVAAERYPELGEFWLVYRDNGEWRYRRVTGRGGIGPWTEGPF